MKKTIAKKSVSVVEQNVVGRLHTEVTHNTDLLDLRHERAVCEHRRARSNSALLFVTRLFRRTSPQSLPDLNRRPCKNTQLKSKM